MSLLTIKNFESQCAISTYNAPAELGPNMALLLIGPGPWTIPLAANPASDAFALGPAPWHHTVGDAGSGDPGTIVGTGATATSTTVVTFGGQTHACVWVCCTLADGAGCPTTDQCP
jgi:hypothetical protein